MAMELKKTRLMSNTGQETVAISPFVQTQYRHPVIYPDPPQGGVITPPPSFHATPPSPQPSEVQRGLSGGVYGGCLCDRDGRGQILT